MSNGIQIPKGPLPPNYFTEYRGHILIIVGILFVVLNLIAFGLRAISRRIKYVPLGWDDILIIPALVFNLVLDVMLMLLIPYGGVGHHTIVTPKNFPAKFKFLSLESHLIVPILYIFSVNLSKGAIIQMFLRILKIGWARHCTITVGVILILQTIAILFTILFQCEPISTVWTTIRRDSCIDIQSFFAFTSIPNIVTDMAILVLPLPCIWKLNASVQLKIGITITILTGSIGIITSILRTVGFFTIPIFSDPTWLNITLYAYTIAEPGTYFLAACFPTYRPLIRYIKSERFRSAFSTGYWMGSKKYGDITTNEEASTQGSSKQRNSIKGSENFCETSIDLAERGQSSTNHEIIGQAL